MKESIPRLREAIKEASMVELKDFLETIRKCSPKIGELAMRNTAARLKVAEATVEGGERPGKEAKVAPQPNPFTGK